MRNLIDPTKGDASATANCKGIYFKTPTTKSRMKRHGI